MRPLLSPLQRTLSAANLVLTGDEPIFTEPGIVSTLYALPLGSVTSKNVNLLSILTGETVPFAPMALKQISNKIVLLGNVTLGGLEVNHETTILPGISVFNELSLNVGIVEFLNVSYCNNVGS